TGVQTCALPIFPSASGPYTFLWTFGCVMNRLRKAATPSVAPMMLDHLSGKVALISIGIIEYAYRRCSVISGKNRNIVLAPDSHVDHQRQKVRQPFINCIFIMCKV